MPKFLNTAVGDGSGLTGLNASNLSSGAVAAARMPALTGDVTTTAGAVATAIGAGKVTNAMLAGSIAASNLVGSDITTVGTVTAGTWSATAVAAAKGGTGLTSYATGDVLYGSAANTLAALAGNTTSTKKFLTQTGSGSVSAAPAWGTLAAGDVPNIAESQVTNLTTDLAAKAPLASPSFTGTVRVDSHYGAITADTDGATVTFNAGTSDKHTVTLGGNRTLAVTGDQDGQVLTIELVQDGTGSRTVTWWSGIRWANGTAPTLATAAGKADLVTIYRRSSGSYAGALSIPNY